MGQILSAIFGEKFVTSPANPSYSNDGYGSENEAGTSSAPRPWNWKGGDSDEEEKPLFFQSSRGLVFQMFLETAAKKVVEDCSGNYESIIGKKETVKDDSSYGYRLGSEAGIETSTIPLNGVVDKPAIIQSRGSVFHFSSEPVEKKGNDDNPLIFNGAEQRTEVCYHKDEAIDKKWKKVVKDSSNNEAIVENGIIINTSLLLPMEDKDKPLNFQSSRGPVSLVLVEPLAKKGNGKQDQSNKQIKEVGLHKNVAISTRKAKKKMKNKIVEDNNKNVDKDKSLIFQSSTGLSHVLVEPVAKKGNGKQDQSNEQRKEVGLHKNVAISTRRGKKKMKNKIVEDINNEIVWLKHYNNRQRILMVGEGDFSFSASLAVAFGSYSSNITATSFNDLEYLRFSYKNATKNIDKLRNRGAAVWQCVDATKMSNYSFWKGIKFDRIIYNFPFSACPQNKPLHKKLRRHQDLVSGFLFNAKEMLAEGGQIHISHKTNKKHLDWNLKELAESNGLFLVDQVKFNQNDYPGYETKQGYNGDNNFDCYPSSTYMFASSVRIGKRNCSEKGRLERNV